MADAIKVNLDGIDVFVETAWLVDGRTIKDLRQGADGSRSAMERFVDRVAGGSFDEIYDHLSDGKNPVDIAEIFNFVCLAIDTAAKENGTNVKN